MKKLRLDISHRKTLTAVNQKGFTLIELMIVIAVIAILSVGIYVFFNNISVKSTAERTKATTQQKARSVLDMMARDIRMLGLDPLERGNIGTWTGSAKSSPAFGTNYIAFSADLDYNGSVSSGSTHDDFEEIAYYINDNGILIMETFMDNNREFLEMIDGLEPTDLVFIYLAQNGSELTPANAALNSGRNLFSVTITLTVRADSLEGEIDRTYSTTVRLRNR